MRESLIWGLLTLTLFLGINWKTLIRVMTLIFMTLGFTTLRFMTLRVMTLGLKSNNILLPLSQPMLNGYWVNGFWFLIQYGSFWSSRSAFFLVAEPFHGHRQPRGEQHLQPASSANSSTIALAGSPGMADLRSDFTVCKLNIFCKGYSETDLSLQT